MGPRLPNLDFEGHKRLFKFEVSRFPFLPEERRKPLRRAYRELEASLRNIVRELEFSWGETPFVSGRAVSARLGEARRELQTITSEHGRHLSREMRAALDELCGHLGELQSYVLRTDAAVEQPVSELCRGLEALKGALGGLHRL